MHSTPRLELTPLSADVIDALLDGDAARLRSLTGAEFRDPAGPPPYMAESLPVVRDRLREYPAELEWWNWLVVRRDNRQAVGSVAFGGLPDAAGAVLLGYAMYPEVEGSGYATEAIRAMVDWAFAPAGSTDRPGAGTGVEHAGGARRREGRHAAGGILRG